MTTSQASCKKRGFTTPEASEYIGRSTSWLRKKRLRGVDDPGDPGPRYLKTDTGSAIYLKEDLDAWLDRLASSEPRPEQVRRVIADPGQSGPLPIEKRQEFLAGGDIRALEGRRSRRPI